MRSTCAARPYDSRGIRAANSPEVEAVRRALQAALPHGVQAAIGKAAARSPRRVANQIEGSAALTVDVLVASLRILPEADRVRIARLVLGPINLFPASLPASRKLLPSIAPAAASVFPLLGQIAEAAALAEADGKVTSEEADEIREEAGEATATLAAVVETAEVAAGMRLAP